MDFTLSERELQVQSLARDFAVNEIAPFISKYDDSQEFPFEIINKMAELGFLGIIFPEEYGGSGFSMLEYILIIEEISKVDP
ncbi:MAG TPA: acyl-CoA dehydrogenase family protein, partial [Ignavibacteria bacterium]|nr:acyl-CoA dehydrogenase family protein [Ignavibacteria bacterium]